MDREDATALVSGASPLSAVTITCGLGERRQMQIAVNLCFSDPPEMQNRILDNAMALADRQQARYDLEKDEESFRQVGMNIRNMLAGMGIAENVLKNQIAGLKAQIEGVSEAAKEVHDVAYSAHGTSGRRGEFKATGVTLQKLNAAEAEKNKLVAALEAAPRDAEQERMKLVASIQRYQEDLAARRSKINDMRQMAGLNANEDFMDEQTAKV